ncbi:MAG: PTS sugar transporter subunit IIA [Betaproteobacteria bacterium]|nr:PTS sugar transporter subunit IIA [Betaproteobacteria bacterium]
MSLIATLLRPTAIRLDVQAPSRTLLFEELARLFASDSGLRPDLISRSLTAREALGSTALGHGVAVPHGRVKGLPHAMAAFARLSAPIPFDAPDGQPVRLVFALLVPEQATELHLQILGEVAEMFSSSAFRTRLLTALDPLEVHHLITAFASHDATHRPAAV